MTLEPDINAIVATLRELNIIDPAAKAAGRLNGTTDGQVYTITVDDEPGYVLKRDYRQNIALVEQLHHAYKHSALLPELLYTDPGQTFIVYSYIRGTTHDHRGSKASWLALLVTGLINGYQPCLHTDKWGFWLEEPCRTWREFIARGVEFARITIGSRLPADDYAHVKGLINNISEGEAHERLLLHGDLGVHNFVFDQKRLKAVIDPSPIAGPVLYDFVYAFCSSPDDLNLETLLPAFAVLNREPMERARLIEEVVIQLYCRIGTCLQHHPHDLADYLKAWDYWKSLCFK